MYIRLVASERFCELLGGEQETVYSREQGSVCRLGSALSYP